MPTQRDPNFGDLNLITDLGPLISMGLWAPLLGPVVIVLLYQMLINNCISQVDVKRKSC